MLISGLFEKKIYLTYQRLDKPISCLRIKIELTFENTLSLIKDETILKIVIIAIIYFELVTFNFLNFKRIIHACM